MLEALGFVPEVTVEVTTKLPQEGARMVPIQTAALLPLLSVAPRFAAATEQQFPFALKYTRAATRDTVRDAPDNASLAPQSSALGQ